LPGVALQQSFFLGSATQGFHSTTRRTGSRAADALASSWESLAASGLRGFAVMFEDCGAPRENEKSRWR
jgi:hypothetical protein